MSGSKADRRKGGRAGRPKKISPIIREGVRTRTVVEERVGGADIRRWGNPILSICTQYH